MKYSIIKVINGNFSVHGEYGTNLQSAIIAFHSFCAALWNDPDTQVAMVKIVDENIDCVDKYMEYINKAEPVETEDGEDI